MKLEGKTRVRIPHAPLGSLEVVFGGTIQRQGIRIGLLPECDIFDYSGIGHSIPFQDVWFIKHDEVKPGKYVVRRITKLPSPHNWAVITSSGAIASCRMSNPTISTYAGEKEKAIEWADLLNESFSGQDY